MYRAERHPAAPARGQCYPRWISSLCVRGREALTLRSPGTCVLRRTEPQTRIFRGGTLWASRGSGGNSFRPAGSERCGGQQWRVDRAKREGEGRPAANRLDDPTTRHFVDGGSLPAPGGQSPGARRSPGGGGGGE